MARRLDTEIINAWDRQRSESAKAFAAFEIYRNMGVERTLKKVAEQVGKSQRLMCRWSSDNAWVERCLAWDRYEDTERQKEMIVQARKAQERHAKMARTLIGRVAEWLVTFKPKDMSTSDAIKMLEVAVKMEREAFGAAGVVVDHHVTTSDPSKDVTYRTLGELGIEPNEAAIIGEQIARMMNQRPIATLTLKHADEV